MNKETKNPQDRPANNVKMRYLDGPNMGGTYFASYTEVVLVPMLRNQLEILEAENRRLRGELDRYKNEGRVADTTYRITRETREEIGVYKIGLSEEFKEICDRFSHFGKLCRSMVGKRMGREFLNEITVFLAEECLSISREEAIEKINRSGDATDSVTTGIRAIRDLVEMFGHMFTAVDPKFPCPGNYAAKIRQLASSMNVRDYAMFHVWFTEETLTDARVYRDLYANQAFRDKISRFQLDLQFAMVLLLEYPLLFAKPVGYLIDTVTAIRTTDDILRTVRAFWEGISVTDHAPADGDVAALDDLSCDVLEFCLENGSDGISAKCIAEHCATTKSILNKRVLTPLREREYLEFVSTKAHSNTQRYRITQAGTTVLRQMRPSRTYPEPSRTDSATAPTDSDSKTE